MLTNRELAADKRIAWIPAVAVALMVTTPALAQQQDEGFAATVDIGIEYDDNLSLGSGQRNDSAQDDFVFRLKPGLSWYHQHLNNSFTLRGGADWRRGFDSDLDLTASERRPGAVRRPVDGFSERYVDGPASGRWPQSLGPRTA